jgi:hypothetical protein
MKIHHEPHFDVNRVCELYSKKDGVPVQYVCTSATNEYGDFSCDVFYRESPHPEFGNRYFALYRNQHFDSDGTIMITNADKIEELTFEMYYSKTESEWFYSQHRYDFRPVPGAGINIDGGRSYVRIVGDIHSDFQRKNMKVKDGKFVEVVEV